MALKPPVRAHRREHAARPRRRRFGDRLTMAVRFYQVGSFAVGNRLVDVEPTAPSSPTPSGPTRSPRATGPARAVARLSAPAMRSMRPCAPPAGSMVAVNATGLPRGVLDPLPRDVVADRVVALLVRQRAGGGDRASRQRCGSRAIGDTRVIGQAGDGGTVDIGFGCLSGMFERNDDVLFICYDNEAYMNTGVQRSGATPPAARTATTEAVGPNPGNPFGQGKNMPELAMAHGIPYVATATVADLHDLEDKVSRAMEIHGARYIHILVTCPLGWGSAPSRHGAGGAAGDPDGPLPGLRGGARRGRALHRPSAGLAPVTEYLRLQGRFAPPLRRGGQPGAAGHHRRAAGDGRPQHRSLRPPRGGRGGAGPDAEKPFAITLEVGIQPGQQDRHLAGRAAGVRRPPAPVQQRLPGRREHPAVAVPGRGRLLRGGLAPDHARQPFPAVMGRACFHPCQTACNRAAVDETVGINADGAVPGRPRARARAGARPRGTAPRASGCSWSAPDPAASRPPTTCDSSGTRSWCYESSPLPGGMMRYGIPSYRLPRDVVEGEVERIAPWASRSCAGGRSTTSRRP